MTRKGERMKSVLFRSAYALFIEQGHSKTTYQDISNRSGCKKSLVQYYFPEKDEFIREFFRRWHACTDTKVHSKQNTLAGVLCETVRELHLLYSYTVQQSDSPFSCELLESRLLKREYIPLLKQRQLDKLEGDAEVKKNFERSYVISFGGYIHLLHQDIHRNEVNDASYYAVNQVKLLQQLVPELAVSDTSFVLEDSLLSSASVSATLRRFAELVE